MSSHIVRVRGLPRWLPVRRLLGAGAWRTSAVDEQGLLSAEAELARDAAADVSARLRGVGLAGRKLIVEVEPPLSRGVVRRARLAEARRMRAKSPGFSRPGTRVDREGRQSLTPEALALALGRRAQRAHVVDAGCGAGGNAIGFARAGCRVTAIEIDPGRLALARSNARIYGVAGRIRFLTGDACELVPQLGADLLFVDPPWGERYDRRSVALADLQLLQRLLAERPRFARGLWAKVPPSFDPSSTPDAQVSPFFGVGQGDARRIKFLLLEFDRRS